MRLDFLVIVSVFCLTRGRCGIIAGGGLNRAQDDGKTLEERTNAEAKYIADRSEVSEDVSESTLPTADPDAVENSLGPSPVIKQKRCCASSYSMLGLSNPFYPNPLPVLSSRTSQGIARRDVQSQLTKRLCTSCLARPPCRVHRKCEICASWCTPEQISSIMTTGKPVETTTVAISTVATPVVGSSQTQIDEPKIVVASRFGGSKNIHMKRIHTIATLRSGNLKQIICKLLGISDISDIDTVVVWVTTRSNQPPQFDPEYKKAVTPEAEKLTQKLNEELDKALQTKKEQHEGNYLTNDEIVQVMNRIPMEAKNGKTGEPRSSWSEEFLPIYPIDPSGFDSEIPRILNPPVIEDAPDISLLGSENEQNVESRIGESGTTSGDAEKPVNGTPSITQSVNETEKDKEDNTLRTAHLKQKLKNKNTGILPAIPAYHPKLYRANEDQGESVVGASENEQTERNGGSAQDIEMGNTVPIVVTTKTPPTVTLPTIETTRKSVEDDLTQSSTKENLIVSPFTSDSDEKEDVGATHDEIGTRTENDEGDKMDTGHTVELKERMTVGNLVESQNGVPPQPNLARTNEGPNESTVNSDNEQKKENGDAEKHEDDNKLRTAKLIQKLKNKKAGKLPGRPGYYPQLYRANENVGESGASENNDEDENNETEKDQEDNKLRTAHLKQKLKNKHAGKLPAIPTYHSKLYRANEDPGESVVGVTENEQTGGNTKTETPPKEKLSDRFGTSKLIQKIKEKKAKKMPAGYHTVPQYYRSNSDENDTVVGVTESNSHPENVTPALQVDEKPPQDEHSPLTIDTESTPKPISHDQVKVEDTSDSITPKIEDKQTDEDIPLDDRLDTSQATINSEDALINNDKRPVTLKARTNALLGKIRERIEQQKKKGLQAGYKSVEDEKLGTPNEVDGTKRTVDAEPTPIDGLEAIKNMKAGTRDEAIKPSDMADHNGQELIKVQLTDQISPAVIVDDFDTAKAVLKDVEKLVGDIQKDTNIAPGKELNTQHENIGTQLQAGMTTNRNDISIKPTHLIDPTFETLGPRNAGKVMDIVKGKAMGVVKNVPQYLLDKSKDAIQTIESKLGQPQEGETKSDNLVGSQPLEELVSYDMGQPTIKIPDYRRDKERVNLGSVPQENIVGVQNVDLPKVFPEGKFYVSPDGRKLPIKELTTTGVISNDRSTNELTLGQKPTITPVEMVDNRIDINTRGKFSGEVDNIRQPIWSNSLGKIVSTQHETGLVSMEPKDIFFIGNGIKLPLQMVRKNDGAVHLSVDLDKLCSCRNTTCPKNHTAIAETVGTILEKEAELKDQLSEAESDLEDIPVGTTTPKVDNKIARDTSGVDGGKSVMRRMERGITDNNLESSTYDEATGGNIDMSEETTELNVSKMSDRKITQRTNAKDNSDRKPAVTENDVNTTDPIKNNLNNTSEEEKSNLSPFLFKQLMDKKITELKSKIFNIGKKNDLLTTHLIFPQDGIKNLLSSIGKEIGKIGSTTQESMLNKNEPKSNLLLSPLMLNKRVESNLDGNDRGDEKNDMLIPIKKVHKFEKLEEDLEDKLEKFNEFVNQYVKDNKKIISEGAKNFIRIHEDGTLRKEIDIMNKLITWMKHVAVDKEGM